MRKDDNPWVGLRAYKEGEILYGRDKDIRELSMYVLAETEVVLYGKSGTGKSSILNAGVIPAARRNGFVPIIIRLEHNVNSPTYITQIKNAIIRAGVKIEPVNNEKNVGDTTLLWDFFHSNEFYNNEGEKVKLLIIFDQFEEIFTLQDSKIVREQFFKEVADLLNDIKPRELTFDIASDEDNIDEDTDGDLSNEDIFAQIEQIDFDENPESEKYAYDNCIHFVFTLREDYLSDFEYHTKKIPSLKQHRYAFRPIDEQQAMDIIVKPKRGLVSEDVACRIIRKISSTTGWDVASGSNISTVILSLFLSELYQRLPENATSITLDMLDKVEKNIIKDFYVSSVSNESKIRPEAVEWMEDILLTKDNHRDNKVIDDVLDKEHGLTEAELDYLENDRRILSRFKRAKITRLEFIHDVIADVAAQHKQAREAEQEARKERAEIARKAKRKFWATIIISAILILGLGSLMWYLMANQIKGLPQKQSFIISLQEDSLTTENDYWKGNLTVTGHRVDAPDTILLQTIVDKGMRDSVFHLEIDTMKSVSFALSFPSYSKYQDIAYEKDYHALMKVLNIKVPVNKKQPKTYSYYGNVSVEENGIIWPIQNALICLHDIATRTDSSGNFKYYLESEVTEDDDIFIIKKGFATSDFKAIDKDDDNKVHNFLLTPKDSIQAIKIKVAAIDSILHNKDGYIIKDQKVIRGDGTSDILNLKGMFVKRVDDKYSIEGYFYFKSDMNQDKSDDKLYSYYIFTGEIDRSWKDGYKNYSIEGKNHIGNVIDITGTYKYGKGSWTGDITSPVGFNASF